MSGCLVGIHLIKGVTDALVLTHLNFANSIACQKQSNGDASQGVYCIHTIYLHTRGAFSIARFDKQGNAKAQMRGTSEGMAPRSFSCVSLNLKL